MRVARSLAPEYLRYLGATATIVGIVTGPGEFVGYAFRLLSGALADKTKAYWFFIFLGYGLIAAIPALEVARVVELALVLVLLERLGKAVRAPSRDTVLSLASKDVGTGKTLGIHKLLDQTGAVLDPAIISGLMLTRAGGLVFGFFLDVKISQIFLLTCVAITQSPTILFSYGLVDGRKSRPLMFVCSSGRATVLSRGAGARCRSKRKKHLK